jgi:SAM-dependent methyltransferase
VNVRGRLRGAAWLAAARTGPVSEQWGRDRGTPVDRWYIERFLGRHASDIRGHVLEVMDDTYTTQFGTAVDAVDVLDVDENNRRATLVADLAEPAGFPPATYDCILLTQTLQYVYDLPAAVESIHRSLRPGGVCLATVPVVSRLDRAGIPRGEFWRITPVGCERLFGDRFGADRVEVTARGSTLSCVAFLLGLSAEEVGERELLADHPFFPLLVTVRALRG